MMLDMWILEMRLWTSMFAFPLTMSGFAIYSMPLFGAAELKSGFQDWLLCPLCPFAILETPLDISCEKGQQGREKLLATEIHESELFLAQAVDFALKKFSTHISWEGLACGCSHPLCSRAKSTLVYALSGEQSVAILLFVSTSDGSGALPFKNSNHYQPLNRVAHFQLACRGILQDSVLDTQGYKSLLLLQFTLFFNLAQYLKTHLCQSH